MSKVNSREETNAEEDEEQEEEEEKEEEYEEEEEEEEEEDEEEEEYKEEKEEEDEEDGLDSDNKPIYNAQVSLISYHHVLPNLYDFLSFQFSSASVNQ